MDQFRAIYNYIINIIQLLLSGGSTQGLGSSMLCFFGISVPPLLIIEQAVEVQEFRAFGE